jgi:hypothetical protein
MSANDRFMLELAHKCDAAEKRVGDLEMALVMILEATHVERGGGGLDRVQELVAIAMAPASVSP